MKSGKFCPMEFYSLGYGKEEKDCTIKLIV